MSAPRLSVPDAEGTRLIPLDKATFLVGRRTTADLQMTREDVSREHARIDRTGDQCVLSDLGSRFGTFVNGEPLTAPRMLVHGDRIGFGRTGAAEVTFLTEEGTGRSLTEGPAEMSDLRQMAAILNGLRALGSGRVLDEVLALVLGSALEVTGAERGFIMLATPSRRARVPNRANEEWGRARRVSPSRRARRFPTRCSRRPRAGWSRT